MDSLSVTIAMEIILAWSYKLVYGVFMYIFNRQMSFILASLYLPRDETALINWSRDPYKVIFQEMEPE